MTLKSLDIIILNSTDKATIKHILKDNPDLSYEFVRQLLIAQTEVDAGKFKLYKFG